MGGGKCKGYRRVLRMKIFGLWVSREFLRIQDFRAADGCESLGKLKGLGLRDVRALGF